MNLTDSSRIRGSLAIGIAAVLLLSTLLVSIPPVRQAEAQAQLPRDQRNWEYINGNSWAWNYNPQTQITKENVQSLEMKWMFPIPAAATFGARQIKGVTAAEGAVAPPIIVDGVVYLITNMQAIFALDLATGKKLWEYEPTFDANEAIKEVPIRAPSGHTHAIYYIDGKLWFNSYGCTVKALDPATGKEVYELKYFCKDVPTNNGIYAGGAFGSHPPVIYKKGNTLITAIGGATEGTWGGRAFVAGYDLTTKALKWRTFYVPPEGKAFPAENKKWLDDLVANCAIGNIMGIPACDVRNELAKDWCWQGGCMWYNSGVSNIWGQMAVDEDEGAIYLGTAQPGPDFNTTYGQGPRLFGNTVLKLDANTGAIKWWFQSTPKDLWDVDCSWNTVLGNIGNKKVVFKGCKNGRVHALDAANGRPIWIHELEAVTFSTYYCNAACNNQRPNGLGLLKPEQYAHPLDPRVPADMNKPWQNYPDTGPVKQSPPGSGAIESDIAFDGKTIYVASKNDPAYFQINHRGIECRQPLFAGPGKNAQGQYDCDAGWIVNLPRTGVKENSTLTAIDAATGQKKWSFFLDGYPFRGGVIVSGGVVYMNGWDGNLYMVDADTGKVLASKNLGQGLDVQPSIGATKDGKMRILQIFGGRNLATLAIPGRPSVPGAIMVYGLPDKLPEPVVKEVIKEVIKEVPKEIVKEVTVETISPLTYAVMGVSVIILVIAGVLFTRRKKA
ncbi:MAG: hypothetical protein FJ358_02280 [Thaumarchaeota archaeon]|nr:hypothetical protein [Nitrososphaerota archaeon]